MRKKIAKRRRREILKLGGVITKDEWVQEDFCVKVEYFGWHIFSAGWDPLEAYQIMLTCIKKTVPYLPERTKE